MLCVNIIIIIIIYFALKKCNKPVKNNQSVQIKEINEMTLRTYIEFNMILNVLDTIDDRVQ